jgi:hypothetical protein
MLSETFNSNISGLIPYENYSYLIEPIDSNWPVRIYPISGTINSFSSNIKVDSKIYFCEELAHCSGYLPYTTGLYRQGDDPFVDVRLKLTSDVLDNPIYGHITTIVCEDCVPIPTVSATPSLARLSTSNRTSVSLNFTNLRPFTTYNYDIKDIETNYPIVIENIPLSGSFTTQSSNIFVLRTDVIFCNYEDCSGDNVIGSSNLFKVGSDQCSLYYSSFNVELTSNYLLKKVSSQPLKIECENCLPKINITAAPRIVLNSTSNNTANIITNLAGLRLNNIYNYVFEYIDGNHSINILPLSGYFYSVASTEVVSNRLSFCESSGLCNPATRLGTALSGPDVVRNARIRFKLDSDCLDGPVYSNNDILISCVDCFPKTSIGQTAITRSDNLFILRSNINNLKPYTRYHYNITNFTSNHLIGFDKLSGIIETSSNTSTNLINNVIFSETTGTNAQYQTTGVFNNNYDSEILTTTFNISLSSSLLDEPIVSNPITLECAYCIRPIGVSSATNVNLTSNSGNIYNLSTSLTNLKPYSTYTYKIIDIDSNHLIGFENLSGVVKTAANTSATINNKIAFCESSGYCNNYYTTGTMNNNTCDNLLSTSFRIELDSNKLPKPVYGEEIKINCNNCLPDINIILPNNINLTSNNITSITGIVSGLKPLQSYDYYFTGDNNWPVVLDNISGSFIAQNSTDSIVAKVLFCSPSGDCAGDDHLLPYAISSPVDKILNNNNLYSKLQLHLKSSSCDSTVYSSKNSLVSCQNCLPCIRYADVSISGSPIITLDDGCCVGQKLLTVNVMNAIPGNRYTYQFTTNSGIGVNNLEFNPMSGEIYFGSGGAGRINTICNIDLIDYTQTLVNFELTHDLTNRKVIDSIGLVCNTGSCY